MRVKAKNKLAGIYGSISNLRDDFLHKLSTRLIKENCIICIKDLRLANMLKNHKLDLTIISEFLLKIDDDIYGFRFFIS
ncbi:transposase [Calothrix sp. PCC 6303]|uniref:transposase n=1 Tax=Calothrix sp. PCC 6303 TaxID=1170562 RepID=UPI0009FD81AF|nr:transposase [Calothrix sp. PCC 6303]